MTFRLLIVLLSVMYPLASWSQTSVVKGLLMEEGTRARSSGIKVEMKGETVLSAFTQDDGSFEFRDVPYGNYTMSVMIPEYEVISRTFSVVKPLTDLGTTTLVAAENNLLSPDNLPAVTLTDNDLANQSSQSVAGVLSAGRDPYAASAAFNFSAARFRNRGYDNENITLMNGIPVEDLSSSRTLFGTWAGLNDVTRSREFTYGLNASNTTYGSLDGSFSIDSRASRQRKQFAFSYANSNRTYDNRFMASYGSGLLTGGWAFAASLSRRWGEEGYVPGTFSDGWSWFAAIEKKIGTTHSISLTHMGANSINGRANPAVQEAYDLVGSNYYNPNWGYQNGVVRNARIGRQQQPLTILSHEWKIDSKSELETSVGYQYGSNSLSGFDWFNAPDPRPDYYRRLPSFVDDSTLKKMVAYKWATDENFRQVDWEGIYNANRNSFETIQDANGISGNTVSGKRSRYIIEERVTDSKRLSVALNYNRVFSDHFIVNSGFVYQSQRSDNYKRVADLLGGDFYVDLNQWAELTYPDSAEAVQNNLDTPNRIVKVGDRFGYSYKSTVNKTMGWAQGQFKFDRFDFFAAFHLASTTFYRTGDYRNGLFANSSEGDSKKEDFNTFGIKGGATYKLNGRNYFFLNGAYETRAPLFENVYVSPRTRNDAIPDLTTEKITSFEGGYLLRAPRVKIRTTLFYTQFNDGYNTISFWHEDYRTLVNYSLSNLDRRHIGLEFGADVNLGQGFSGIFAASIGEYYYTDRMIAEVTQDNSAQVLASNETIYSKNFYVANGPQQAMTIGITYRSPKFWTVNLNANYFGNNYIDFNPARRTVAGVELLEEGPVRESIIDQQKSDGQFTLDFFGTKSWRMSDLVEGFRRNTFLVFNLGVSNLLNNQNLMLTGFEQLRFDYTDKNPNKFPPRYYYGFGRTYFASIIVRFN
ncbi:MAG: hypothetical protein RLZZ630_690 [Bacteroidota bacterium]